MPRAATDSGRHKTYSLRLPEATIEALQNMALAKGAPAAELAREAVEEYIGRYAHQILEQLAEDRARRERAAQDLLAYVDATQGKH